MSEDTDTITFWRQPGGKTFKRQDASGTTHVSPLLTLLEVADLKVRGWRVSDEGHKIKCVCQGRDRDRGGTHLTVDPVVLS